MADNPFYPGYTPGDERLYPGKGMPRGPVHYAPKIQAYEFNETFNELMNDIDRAVTPRRGKKSNIVHPWEGPKWVVEKTWDNVHNAWNVSVYGENVDPTYMDDYDEETLPGAQGITFNIDPIEWVKNPKKQVEKFVRNTASIIIDPGEYSRQAEDEVNYRITARDPQARQGDLAGLDATILAQNLRDAARQTRPSSVSSWADIQAWNAQFDPNKISKYGTGEATNPLALEGLGVVRREVAEHVFKEVDTGVSRRQLLKRELEVHPIRTSGWRGRKKVRARVGVTETNEADIDAREQVFIKEVDVGENVRSAWFDFQRKDKSPVPGYRDKSYQNLLAATSDFVATDLNSLYEMAHESESAFRLTQDESEFIERYLAVQHFRDTHENTGGSYSGLTKTLDKQVMPDGITERVESEITVTVNGRDEEQTMVSVYARDPDYQAPKQPKTKTVAGAPLMAAQQTAAEAAEELPLGKPSVLIARNMATGEYSGDIAKLAVEVRKELELLDETREKLRGDAKLTKQFASATTDTEAQLKSLLGTLGTVNIVEEDGVKKYVYEANQRVQALLNDPSKGAIQKLRGEVETYMGKSDLAMMSNGLWGINTLRGSTESNLNTLTGYGLLAEKDSRIRALSAKYDLASLRMEFYTKMARRQVAVSKAQELYNAWKGGKIPERYAWNSGTKALFKTASILFNPDQIIKHYLGKFHNFGLKAGDKAKFDYLMGNSILAATRLNNLFSNTFRLELDTTVRGKKVSWKTDKFQGGAEVEIHKRNVDGTLALGEAKKKVQAFAGLGDIRDLANQPGGLETLRLMLMDGKPLVTGTPGHYNLNIEFINQLLPNGIETDPAKFQDALGKLRAFQDKVDAFKAWVHENAASLGVDPASIDFAMYKQLWEKLNKQSDFLDITRQYAGLLEKFVAFANKLQTAVVDSKLMEKLGLSQIIKKAGLQQVALKNAIRDALITGSEKLAANLGFKALAQAIGSAAPGVGNAIAFAATIVAEKIVDTGTKFVKETFGTAWNFISKGEVKDIMAEIDENAVKILKKVAIAVFLLVMFVLFLTGSFGVIFTSLAGLGPNSFGSLTGSATVTQRFNLAANPYVVILSTFADIDPTREFSLMPQQWTDSPETSWGAGWPPPEGGGTPLAPGVTPSPGTIEWGEDRLWCFPGGAPGDWRDLPILPTGRGTPSANALAITGYNIINELRQGFWCWNNFSPRYCPTSSLDAGNERCSNIFFWDEFINHPNHCYSFLTITPCTGSSAAIENDRSLFWCTQLIVQAYNAQSGELTFGSALNLAIRNVFDGAGRLHDMGTIDIADQVRPGDTLFIGPSRNRIVHVAMVHSVDTGSSTPDGDYVISMDSNTLDKTVRLTINSSGYPVSPVTGHVAWEVGFSQTGGLTR